MFERVTPVVVVPPSFLGPCATPLPVHFFSNSTWFARAVAERLIRSGKGKEIMDIDVEDDPEKDPREDKVDSYENGIGLYDLGSADGL